MQFNFSFISHELLFGGQFLLHFPWGFVWSSVSPSFPMSFCLEFNFFFISHEVLCGVQFLLPFLLFFPLTSLPENLF